MKSNRELLQFYAPSTKDKLRSTSRNDEIKGKTICLLFTTRKEYNFCSINMVTSKITGHITANSPTSAAQFSPNTGTIPSPTVKFKHSCHHAQIFYRKISPHFSTFKNLRKQWLNQYDISQGRFFLCNILTSIQVMCHVQSSKPSEIQRSDSYLLFYLFD